MDIASIAGNIIASSASSASQRFRIFGRWRGLVAQKTKAKSAETRASDGTQFTILVAELDGDADNSQSRHILAELQKQFPLGGEARLCACSPYPEVLAEPRRTWRERSPAPKHAAGPGLKQMKADVLVWGEQGAKDKVLRLRFLTPIGEGGAQKPYELNSTLELHPDFGADLGAILALQAARPSRPFTSVPARPLRASLSRWSRS